jgi:dihydroorotase
MSTILIRGGRIIDPGQSLDQVGNLFIQDGKIAGLIDGDISTDQVIDATDKIVCPGLIDLFVSLREPGFDEDETIATGTDAAIAGGFTSVVCTPETSPVIQDRAAAEFVQLQAERAGHCNVFPLGAVTKNLEGKELAEIGQLVEGGAVGFTDVKNPITNAEIMRRALEYTSMFNRPILSHPQVPELIAKGVMHEGFYSTLLGLQGMPSASEDIMVGRDIALAELTGGQIHFISITSRNSVKMIAEAKSKGINVTAAVTPHHLALTDESLLTFDSNLKVNPPLRTPEHIEALVQGLKEGTIDAICSDHQPCAIEKKSRELTLVPYGISGLETMLAICIRELVEPGHLSWSELIAKWTNRPADILGIEKGSLKTGRDADITIINPEKEWTVDPSQFRSMGKNTPFTGWKLKGKAETVLVAGKIQFQAE